MSTGALVFSNGTLILPDRTLEVGALVCRDGRISALGHREDIAVPKNATRIDARGGLIGPGYIDIHVHGGDGADFMDGSVEAVQTVLRAHARHGTTSMFPTTTTGSRKQIEAMLSACQTIKGGKSPRKSGRAKATAPGARIGGVHLYGPYFAEDKVGCHLKSGRRDPDPTEYLEQFELGIIRIATCAAELPGSERFYREAARRGYLVTCGHSNASWTEMARGFRAGLRHVDHFWCAMSSVATVRERFSYPMQGSMEQFVLANNEMSTEVIADGCHLSPDLLEFAFQMKGADRLCLCTDANRALGMPPGDYRFGPVKDGEWFKSDGKVGFQPGRGLASAVVALDTMVKNMKAMTSASIAETVRMASLTPAERTRTANETGSLEVGKRADILVLDQSLDVQRVFIDGFEFDRG